MNLRVFAQMTLRTPVHLECVTHEVVNADPIVKGSHFKIDCAWQLKQVLYANYRGRKSTNQCGEEWLSSITCNFCNPLTGWNTLISQNQQKELLQKILVQKWPSAMPSEIVELHLRKLGSVNVNSAIQVQM